MARPAIVFTNRATADTFKAAVDAAFGYPRAGVPQRGTRAGAGVTTQYAVLIKHPTLNRWAYPDEPLIKGKRGAVPIPAGGAAEDLELDAAWESARPV